MPGEIANGAIRARPFTLTMLGTDTVYTPALKEKNAPKIGDYPKGELLSIISSQVKTSSNPITSKTTPAPYTTPEIEVIDGPKTLGVEVGDRIGRGVASILKAIARGQQPINIMAHSRGAVESILIAHEIDSLKRLVTDAADLESLIKALEAQQKARITSKTSSTPDIIVILKDQLKEQLSGSKEVKETFLAHLKSNFPAASINLFAIDPVPGDVRPITWYDPRFYTLPSIIKNAEFLFYENERTDWGFTPLCPEPHPNTPEQKVRYLTIPGHHGTGSAGNDRSQAGKKVGPKDKKATDVQKLLVFKLLEFLSTHHVEFKEFDIFTEGRALGRRSAFRNKAGQFDFPAIYRKLYSDLIKHRKAYEAFNQTSYAMMGVLKDDRRLLRRGGYVKFRERFNLGTGYINEEHAILMQSYFFKKLGIEEVQNTSLLDIVRNATKLLVKNIHQFQANPSPSLFASLSKSLLGTAIPLLTEVKVRQDVLASFEVLVSRVSNKYLTSDWHGEENIADKKAVFAAITQMINQLKQFVESDNEITREFVGHLLYKIAKGIKNTVNQQHLRFKNEIERLTADPLQSYINELVLKLKGIDDKSKNDVIAARIFADPQYILLKEATIETKMQFIGAELSKALPQQTQDYSLDKLLGEFHAYQEIYNDEFADYVKLYEQIHVFIQDLDALGELDPTLKSQYAEMEKGLQDKLKLLIPVAAKRFYSNSTAITTETLVRENFQGSVERFAVQHYAAQNPMIAMQEQSFHAAQQLRNQYIENLNSRKQAEHLLLIQDKLIPITQNYLSELMLFNEADEEARQLVLKKQTHLNTLLLILKNQEFEPCIRVEQFYAHLNYCEQDLGEHRDARWKRYTQNVLLAGLALITGIIPGLIALLVYINTGEKSGKSMWFWQSRGENIVNALYELTPEGLVINPNGTTTA